MPNIIIIRKIMDNDDSGSSDCSLEDTQLHLKPSNRTSHRFGKLLFHSDFSTGNCAAVQCAEQSPSALMIQFWGNSDAQRDSHDKCWFHFKIEGLEKCSYEWLHLRFKNANIYRKFVKERKYRPYVLFREERVGVQLDWKAVYINEFHVLENDLIEADFSLPVSSQTSSLAIASNLPYNIASFDAFSRNLLSTLPKQVYYHRQTIAKSVDDLPIYLCTITSSSNVLSPSPACSNEPSILKERPQILLTARVHPSEVSSSFFVEGLMNGLAFNSCFEVLLHMFIFRVVPIMNPDGVENGHYRLDNHLQNLNRFYGYSNPQKTPSVAAVEAIINGLREKDRLFMFIDVHGHNSPKPAFLFGNFSSNLTLFMENKTFAKLIEVNGAEYFDSLQCQFSKNNTKVKEKYDEHTKQASARVYAHRGNPQRQNLKKSSNGAEQVVEHSYTMEVFPYALSPASRRSNPKKPNPSVPNCSSFSNFPRSVPSLHKSNSMQVSQAEPTYAEILQSFYSLGESTLTSLAQMLGVSGDTSIDVLAIRKKVFRELSSQLDYCSQVNKYKLKDLSAAVAEKYQLRWSLMEGYSQFAATRPNNPNQKQNQLYQKLERADRKDKAQARRGVQPRKAPTRTKEDLVSAAGRPDEKDTNFEVTLISSTQKKKPVSEPNRQPKPIREIQLDSIENSSLRGSENRNNPSRIREERQLPKSQHVAAYPKSQHVAAYPKMGKSTLDELEQRIRRLIFRHKTETELIEFEKDSHQMASPVLPFHLKEKEGYSSSKKSRRNEPKGESQKKIPPKDTGFHFKTEGNRLEEFRDHNIIGSSSLQRPFKEHRKTQAAQGLSTQGLSTLAGQELSTKAGHGRNPKLDEIMRKASIKRIIGHQFETIQRDEVEARHKIEQICRAKKHVLNGESYEKRGEYSGRSIVTMRSNMLLPLVHSSSLEEQEATAFGSPIIYTKPRGHPSIKNKTKKVENSRQKGKQTEAQQMLNSYKASSGSRLDFISRSKKMLVDRKKEELPTITEIQMVTGTKL